jgi:hypothetical protein
VTSRVFVSIMLALPVVLAAIGIVIPKLDFFLFALAIGGVPYLPTVVVLVVLIAKSSSLKELIRLSAIAPVAYGLLLAVFIDFVGGIPEIRISIAERLKQILSMATVGGLFAFGYVSVAWLLWSLCRKNGWVKDEFSS